MTRFRVYAVLSVLFLPSVQATADTIAIQPVTGSGSYFTNYYSGSLGYQFRLNDPIAVTQLGAWDWLSNGLSNSPVGIWTNSGSLLVQDEVTNSDPLTGSTYSGPGFNGRFRYTSLSDSVLLTPGIYRIAVDYAGASGNSFDRYFASSSTPILTGPDEVDYIRSAHYSSNGGNLAFPNQLGTLQSGYFGVNFQFDAVHERHWVIGSGDFGVAGNWVEGAVPDSEDTLVLNESGAINRVINVTGARTVLAAQVGAGNYTIGADEVHLGTNSSAAADRLTIIDSLSITNGEFTATDLQVHSGSSFDINGGAATLGDLTIDSGGSFNFDDGTLTIDGGTITNFRVDSSGDANIRGEPSTAGATATLNLENGATQGFDNFVFVGRQADGFLNVRSGSTVQVGADLLIAQTSGNDSAVTIDGVGSEITVTGATHVGNKGRGTLEITSGGMLTTDRVLAGRGTSGLQEGNILVDGTDSQLITNRLSLGGDEIDVASGGIGRLTISNDGNFLNALDVRVFSGSSFKIDGGNVTTRDLTIDPGGSFNFDDGSLTIDGGNFAHTAVDLRVQGAEAGKLSTLVLKNGATYNDATLLSIGSNKGEGRVEVLSGADVTVSDTVHIASNVASFDGTMLVDGGTVNAGTMVRVAGPLGGPEGLLQIENGAVNAPTLRIREAGTVNFNGGEINVDQVLLSDDGTFSFLGGTLHADLFSGDLTQDGGLITIGNSPGTMTVDGNYTQSAGALEIELGGFNAGSEFDFLDISGTAILSGILDVSFWDGFLPEDHGDSFTFLEADGGVSGSFDLLNSTLPDLSHIAPYSSWAIQYGPNTVTLTVVPEPSSIALAGMGVVCGVVMATRRRLTRRSNP